MRVTYKGFLCDMKQLLYTDGDGTSFPSDRRHHSLEASEMA